MITLLAILHSRLLLAAWAGFIHAFIKDIVTWKSYKDAEYNWRTASWCWFQGAVVGLAAGAGWTGVISAVS